jgi:hypothetical protein
MDAYRKALAVVAAAVVATTLTAGASGGHSLSKQRIAIEGTYNLLTGEGTWVLLPLSRGALGKSSGKGVGTGVPQRPLLKKTGQRVIPITGEDLLTNDLGAIALTERVHSHDASRGYTADTGTFTFTGQLGVYEGYRGGGEVALIKLPNGNLVFRMEGYVNK